MKHLFIFMFFGMLGCADEQIQPEQQAIVTIQSLQIDIESRNIRARTVDCSTSPQLVAYLLQQEDYYMGLSTLAHYGMLLNGECSRVGESCESVYRNKAAFITLQIKLIKQQCP